jgi:hypothetical protein
LLIVLATQVTDEAAVESFISKWISRQNCGDGLGHYPIDEHGVHKLGHRSTALQSSNFLIDKRDDVRNAFHRLTLQV